MIRVQVQVLLNPDLLRIQVQAFLNPDLIRVQIQDLPNPDLMRSIQDKGFFYEKSGKINSLKILDQRRKYTILWVLKDRYAASLGLLRTVKKIFQAKLKTFPYNFSNSEPWLNIYTRRIKKHTHKKNVQDVVFLSLSSLLVLRMTRGAFFMTSLPAGINSFPGEKDVLWWWPAKVTVSAAAAVAA